MTIKEIIKELKTNVLDLTHEELQDRQFWFVNHLQRDKAKKTHLCSILLNEMLKDKDITRKQHDKVLNDLWRIIK